MKRIIIIIVTALTFFPTLSAAEAGKSIVSIGPLRAISNGISVDLWTNKGQDEVYYPGDPIAVYFRATGDCFLTIYSINTEGEINIIFPEYPDDGLIYGGVTYRLPDYYNGMRLPITGPRGLEYLHAVVTRTPGSFLYSVRNGRWYAGIPPITGDPFLAINSINGQLIRARNITATATISYFIGGPVWYPRYACYSCHARSPYFDPYELTCSRYTVNIASSYDYWWAYDYYPARRFFFFKTPFWSFTVRTSTPYRQPNYRYIDYAFGYRNYIPLRPIVRAPAGAVYRPARITTYRSWERSYVQVRASDTWVKRTQDPRAEYRSRDYTVSQRDGTVTRGASSGTTRVRSGVESTQSTIDHNSVRSRERETPDAATSTRSRTSDRGQNSGETSTRTGSSGVVTPAELHQPGSGGTGRERTSGDNQNRSTESRSSDNSRERSTSGGATLTTPTTNKSTVPSSTNVTTPQQERTTTPAAGSGSRDRNTQMQSGTRERSTDTPRSSTPPVDRSSESRGSTRTIETNSARGSSSSSTGNEGRSRSR